MLLATVGILLPQAVAQTPDGSFQASCRNISFQNPILNASCKTDSGDWNRTQLNVSSCIGDIFNDAGGNLRCTTAPLRQGSYQQSCKDAVMAGSVLNATCKSNSGNWRATALEVRQCVGDIFNDAGGNLRCSTGQLPPGSYARTCRDERMSGTTLLATCKDNGGSWRLTSLDMRTCHRDVWNDSRGSLRCGGTGPVPGGSYAASCEDALMDGPVLLARCRTDSGSYNNTALNTSACKTDIFNTSGGSLRCGTGQAPQGSYTASCRDQWMNGTTLFATCRDDHGTWVDTNLNNARACSLDITNNAAGSYSVGRAALWAEALASVVPLTRANYGYVPGLIFKLVSRS